VSVMRTGEGKRGALNVLLVAPEAHRAEVLESLQGLPEPPLEITEKSPDALGASGNGNGNGTANGNGHAAPDVVMVVFNGDEEESLNYLQGVGETEPRPAIFALLRERSPGLMKRVLRAGADELLFLPLDTGDATRALLKISESRRREDQTGMGTVVSMVSLVGGVGVTSLAGNLALALRYSLDKRVGVIDLDLQASSLSVFLNVEPDRTVMALTEGEKKIDSIQLESALSKHSSGIYLLAAPKRIEDSELVTDGAVGNVIEIMRQLFDYVIVDCGTHIDASKVAAWERSQHLFYVLDQSIGAARCAWRFVDLCGRLGLNNLEPAFVISRFIANHPISEEQLSHTLARPIYAKIPRDEKVLERVQLSAQDLWQVAPNSPLTKAVEEMSRKLDGVTDEEDSSRSGSIVSRLLSSFGARG
jgi:pilus assembly protein CpaE